MAQESLGPFRSGCRRKTEVDMFKSKAPDKEKNAVANAAEVVGSTAQQQHSVVEHLCLSETYALKYWWCSPPRTGIASGRPTVWTARETGAFRPKVRNYHKLMNESSVKNEEAIDRSR